MSNSSPSSTASSPASRINLSRAGAALILLVGWLVAGPAQPADDYHQRFEALCGRCHGHSGPFARHSLEIVDGRLIGRTTGVPVERFLRRHPGGLTQADIARFREVMHRQVEAGGVFHDRCAICHGRAVELAAANLAIREGDLVIRYSGEPVRDFLSGHGRLDAREVDIVHRALYETTAGQ